MISQSSHRTGFPMVDLFFNGFATMFEIQRAFGGLMTSAAFTPFRPDQGRHRHHNQHHVEIGATEEQVIPISNEELRVGKRQVQSAKVYRVSTSVVEVPVEEQVNLRAETVVIERRPTTGTTVCGGESFRDHTFEVHEMYEEPVIGKVITQTEEMAIYKTVSERTATIRETVRQTRINVEGQAKIQVPPPIEIAPETKVEELPNASVQQQIETLRETILKAEDHPKVSVPPQVQTTFDTGAKVEEQKETQVHTKAEVGAVGGGAQLAPSEKSPKVQNSVERKDHTDRGLDTKLPRRP